MCVRGRPRPALPPSPSRCPDGPVGGRRALSDPGRRITRPVDAAGLVLIRDGRRGPEVLLGRRHSRTGFLPDIYVVPGGRVDPADDRPTGFPEALHPAVARQLQVGSRGRSGLAFARAAVRETFEETGLLVAAGGAVPTAASRPWTEFAARRVGPAFAALDFICRAITPTYSKRRYNTRFFLADGRAAIGDLAGNGELEDLGWRPVAELSRLPIVDVTEFMLAEALRRWEQRVPIGGEPARLFCYRGEAARWRIGDAGAWRPALRTPLSASARGSGIPAGQRLN
jgi:8-oxo-dGTP pyrophosphatase MutT (NUDIX family)